MVDVTRPNTQVGTRSPGGSVGHSHGPETMAVGKSDVPFESTASGNSGVNQLVSRIGQHGEVSCFVVVVCGSATTTQRTRRAVTVFFLVANKSATVDKLLDSDDVGAIMKNASRLLVPAILAGLLPVADAEPARDVASVDSAVAKDTGRSDASLDSTVPTYGELLVELARKSALRAVQERGSDQAMEAISELAVRWLRMPEGATRVWDQHPRSVHAADKAVRNAQRSLWRTAERHDRLARAVSNDGMDASIEPNQISAVELHELLSAVGGRSRAADV